jgi:general secretion pathway protein K
MNNNKGVALMVAVAALMLIMYFAMEVSYESNVEYIVNSQSLNRVKAYYAAKSGMQLSLLRIKIYQQAQSQLGAQLGDSPILDQIWQFPFAWPLPIPDELNAVDKDAFKKVVKESSMDSSYIVTIEDEGSKIDVNDLNSKSKYLRDSTKTQLLNIFEQKKKDDEEFQREYSNFNFEELVNSIADWMSPKADSLNGGAKNAKYGDLNRETQDYYPPNRAFRTLAELHMIPGMTDTFYDLLEPRITIYGMKGINPNLATKEVLKSLDPAMTDEAVAEIIKRRSSEDNGGPFKCDKDANTSSDFWDFVAQHGVRVLGDPKAIPMTCEKVMNFKIRATGEFASAVREITAIVVDLDRTASKIKSYTDKEKQQPPGATPTPTPNPAGGGASPAQNQKAQIPKGAPRVVFWQEK